MNQPGHRRVPVESRDPATGAVGWTAFRLGWLAVLIVTVTVRAYTLSSWSWYQDDLLLTSGVPGTGLLEYVTQDIAGHVFPGQLFVVWISTTLSPLNYAFAAAAVCFFAALVVVAWGLALRRIFGERLHLLLTLVVLGLSPMATIVSLWTISALQVMPMQAAMGFAVWFLARYLMGEQRRRDLVGMTVSYACGLLMWEKSLLIVIPLVFVVMLLGPGSRRDLVRTAYRVLVPVAAVTLAFLAFYVWAVSDAAESGAPVDTERTFGSAVSFVLHGVLDVVLPSLVGGPFGEVNTPGDIFPAPAAGLSLPLWSAAVVLIIIGIALRRRGLTAVLMVVAYATVSWGLVFASDRFPAYGTNILATARYTADLLPVVLLAVTFLCTRTTDPTVEPLRRPVGARPRVWIGRALVAHTVIVAVAVTIASGNAWDGIAPSSTKPYLDNLVADARAVGNASVYDTSPPARIVDPLLLAPAARISALLGPLGLPLRYNEPAERFVVADDAGHLTLATVEGGIANDGPGPVPDCGYAVDAGGSTAIALTDDLYDLTWGMAVTYFSGSDAVVSISTGADEVELAMPATGPGEVGRLQLVVQGEVTGLTVEGISGDAAVCITEVRIGNVVPSADLPAALAKRS